MVRALIEIRCNCLFSEDNVDYSKVSAIPMVNRNTISSNVARFGNWVGGTVYGLEDRLEFHANAMNAALQNENTLVVAYRDVRSVKIGRMMGLFKTVDVDTPYGQARFRAWGRSNDALKSFVEGRTSGSQDVNQH